MLDLEGDMNMRRNWTRKELLLALDLYCRMPFGKLHQHNPEVMSIAQVIGRTPSAVAMKACNFANLDPNLGRKGLSSVSKADREIWNEFFEDSQAVAFEIDDIWETKEVSDATIKSIPQDAETETLKQVKVRKVQQFFRSSLLVSYASKCAISGLAIPGLLVASHIIPWSKNESRRADPTNGILLNSLYDKAFDKGYMTFDEKWQVCLASDLKSEISDNEFCKSLFAIEGQDLGMPNRFLPDSVAMAYHRNNIFEKSYA